MPRIVTIREGREKPKGVREAVFAADQPKPGSRVDRRQKIGPREWLDEGAWVRVKSSNVAAISYEDGTRQLFVKFLSGAVYAYYEVPRQDARDMYQSASMGRFVWRRLRDKFAYRRIA